MRQTFNNASRLLVLLGSFALGVPAIATAVLGNQDPQQPDSYSSTSDAHPAHPRADHPKMPSSDRSIVQRIRKAIYADKSLADAHHITMAAQDGKVTLR